VLAVAVNPDEMAIIQAGALDGCIPFVAIEVVAYARTLLAEPAGQAIGVGLLPHLFRHVFLL